jgi:hypothetical protein
LTPSPTYKALHPRSFSGWALRPALELDTACPSFLSFVFCASTLKRQAIFMALAALHRDGPESLASRLHPLASADDHACYLPREQIARALMTAPRAREIIRTVFSDLPDGLLGVLTRIGDDPLPSPDLYFALYETFADPQYRACRDVLRQRSGQITAAHIEIIRRLDPVLVHENILKRVYSVSQALDANAAVAMIRGTVSSATEEAIRQSVADIGEKTDLATLFNKWLSKADRLPVCPAIPEDDPDIAVMPSAEAMASLGRRFRNCSTTRIVYVAQGAEVLLEWQHPPGLIAQCHRLTNDMWVLTEIYAKTNGRVEPAQAAVFRRKLEALGIPALSPGDAYPRTTGVQTLLGAWGGIGNNLGFEDEAEGSLDEADEIMGVGDAA